MLRALTNYLRSHWRWFAAALLAVGALTSLSLKLEENFPFSHFPMYGNPQPGDVDYYFLTDASGEPLSTNDYAGITAPQIKKRINKILKEEGKAASKKARKLDLLSRELDAAALSVLMKMREDAADANSSKQCIAWPAGVQLKQGLILTTPQGFREAFRTVATLPDAGPPTQGVHVARPPADGNRIMLAMIGNYLLQYGGVVLIVLLILLAWNKLPPRLQEWLQGNPGMFAIGRLESWAWRAGLALIFWQVLQMNVNFDSLPHPQGLAHWEWWRPKILWLGKPENWNTVQLWSVPLLIWYVFGWANFLPLTALTLVHILQRTLYASQGAPHHGHQLVSLVFCAQVVVAWGCFIRKCCRKKDQPRTCMYPASVHWTAMLVVVATSYVITACSKWEESNGKWLQNAQYFSNQIVKTHRQNYYNDLNPQYLVGSPPVASPEPDPANDRYRYPIPNQAHWMLTHSALSRVFFGMGFLMEFSAFLLIFHRGLAALYGIAIIAFHLMVLWLMELTFPQNIEVVLVLCLNVPGWLVWWKFRRSRPVVDPSPRDPDGNDIEHGLPAA